MHTPNHLSDPPSPPAICLFYLANKTCIKEYATVVRCVALGSVFFDWKKPTKSYSFIKYQLEETVQKIINQTYKTIQVKL